MGVDTQIRPAAEVLDQGHCPCLCRLARKISLLDQVCGDAAMDDIEHSAHDGRAAGEQIVL